MAQIRFASGKAPAKQTTARRTIRYAGGQPQPKQPQPAPGSWSEALRTAANASAQLIRMAGAGIGNAWNNRIANAQARPMVTPQQRQQAVNTYNNMQPPTGYAPNPTNPYASPGFIQSGANINIGGMPQASRDAYAARSRGAGLTAANPPGFYAQRAQQQAAREQDYYRQVRSNKAYTDRLTGLAADYYSKPKGMIDGLTGLMQPPADYGDYGDYGGYGYGGGGYGGGGGGDYEQVREFWNTLANWNVNRPQGG